MEKNNWKTPLVAKIFIAVGILKIMLAVSGQYHTVNSWFYLYWLAWIVEGILLFRKKRTSILLLPIAYITLNQLRIILWFRIAAVDLMLELTAYIILLGIILCFTIPRLDKYNNIAKKVWWTPGVISIIYTVLNQLNDMRALYGWEYENLDYNGWFYMIFDFITSGMEYLIFDIIMVVSLFLFGHYIVSFSKKSEKN